jgi:hypothetical protein
MRSVGLSPISTRRGIESQHDEFLTTLAVAAVLSAHFVQWKCESGAVQLRQPAAVG